MLKENILFILILVMTSPVAFGNEINAPKESGPLQNTGVVLFVTGERPFVFKEEGNLVGIIPDIIKALFEFADLDYKLEYLEKIDRNSFIRPFASFPHIRDPLPSHSSYYKLFSDDLILMFSKKSRTLEKGNFKINIKDMSKYKVAITQENWQLIPSDLSDRINPKKGILFIRDNETDATIEAIKGSVDFAITSRLRRDYFIKFVKSVPLESKECKLCNSDAPEGMTDRKLLEKSQASLHSSNDVVATKTFYLGIPKESDFFKQNNQCLQRGYRRLQESGKVRQIIDKWAGQL